MDLLIALFPAVVMIVMVITTRKVLLSLGVGTVLAALIFVNFNPIDAAVYLWDSFFGIVTSFDWYLPIIGFVLLIGGITAVIAFSGGIRAFAEWAVLKVKSPVAAKMLTWVLGLIIFIDDYFNALVIGEVTKPITDKYRVSRAKLAYIIDSTSAPVVILMPISTWGAFIIGILGGLFVEAGYEAHSGFGAYVAAVPYQFYPIAAIVMVVLTIQLRINVGSMREYESRAADGDDISIMVEDEAVPEEDVQGVRATHWYMIVPILALIVMTLSLMFWSAGFDPAAFMDQEITIPLFFGGLTALLIAVIYALLDKAIERRKIAIVAGKGMFTMLKSAVAILILAWMVSGAIQDLEVGDIVAGYIAESNLQAAILPFIMFFIAGGIAFATGTSWGAFGILLPIAVPIAMATDPSLMPIIIAAVLGGAVFGDHSSPVSDTTVLSSTGARSKVHAHFISQLPYAMITAFIAAIGYLMFGLFQNLIVSYLVMAGLFVVFVKLFKTVETEDVEHEG